MNTPNRPAIIIPAFDRPDALSRLLNTINHADYPGNTIQLIISIDGGASDPVREIADRFDFIHGDCKVIHHPANMGLRKHIVWCGENTSAYDAVIILEDDLIVDRYFYRYAISACSTYLSDDRICGISLYAQKFNEYLDLYFDPVYNGCSSYFMQVPSSWGQVWSARSWRAFKSWYDHNASEKGLARSCLVPSRIKTWPETSWKKYYSLYMCATKKYFVYPYHAYTSNCADAGGVHIKRKTNYFQTPMGYTHRECEHFFFPSLSQGSIVYDGFMEPEPDVVAPLLGVDHRILGIDLYGYKPAELFDGKDLLLTSRDASQVIQSYPLAFRPLEKNFEFPCSPEDAFFRLAETGSVDFETVPCYQKLKNHGIYSSLPRSVAAA